MKFFLQTTTLLFFFGTALPAQIKLNAEAFAARMGAQEDIQLIDVRTADEYKEGHLKSALNLDIRRADFATQIQGLAKGKPVMVYCLAGTRSEAAARMLADSGFAEIYDLDGGYMNWTVEKRPVEGIKAAAGKEALGMRVFEYNEMINSEMPVLVDFTAKWCAPCKAMYPHIRNIENEFKGRAMVRIIDIDKHPTVAEHLGIRFLPLIYLYKNGAIVWQTTGAVSENKLREVITQQL